MRRSECRRALKALAAPWFAAGVFLVALFYAAALIHAQQGSQPPENSPGSAPPPNPAFVEFLNRSKLAGASTSASENGRSLGHVPERINFSHLVGTKPRTGALAVSAALPSSYDLRTYGRMTEVRNQGACGTCWIFASYGALESSLKPTETRDFSENHLKNLHGFDIGRCFGQYAYGNPLMAIAYLARWTGPVDEYTDPYVESDTNNSPAGMLPQKHIQDVLQISPRSGPLDNEALKNAVIAYGGIYTPMLWRDPSYEASTASYYYDGAVPPETGEIGHAVTLAGWDDNYSRSNFRSPGPPGDGAFLVKNSWKDTFGKAGYFWISYYDASFARVLEKRPGISYAFVNAESTANYSRVYQYDPLGLVDTWGWGGGNITASFANVFTAADDEQLKAVSFYVASHNSPYTIRIYTGVAGTTNPTNGVLASTSSGTIASAGYHTIVLPGPVALAKGMRFSVVVRLTTPGYDHPIPVEYAAPEYSSAAQSSAGQSFYSPAGESPWYDAAATKSTMNVCVKAFTAVPSVPATIAAETGTSQSAAINTVFASPFSAIVRDTAGAPVAGATVTFTAPPASQAGGTFAGSVRWMTAVTNASGIATSSAFTANAITGSFVVGATVPGVAITAYFFLTNTAPPASIAVSGGSGQTAPVNTYFSQQLAATVKDASGNAIGTASVTFSAPATGPGAIFPGDSNTATVFTNNSGVATCPFLKANTITGTYTVTATVPGVASPATFTLTNSSGSAASISASGGSGQNAVINAPFALPLSATVRDAGGNPVNGALVTFTPPSGGAGGSFAGGVRTAISNSSGVATSPVFTANSVAGAYTISASVAGASTAANFTLTNTAGPPATIVASGGTPQSAPVLTAFPVRFAATVKDVGGNPVSGATVTFNAPLVGPTGGFAGGLNTAVTNGAGVATAGQFVANGLTGAYTVAAGVSGVATQATFALTNTTAAPGPPASISVASGGDQTTLIKTEFPNPMVAVVKDAVGNPVPGVSVYFTAGLNNALPTGQFSGVYYARVTTDASGLATAPSFTANAFPGSYDVSASPQSFSGPAAMFAMTNVTGWAARVSASGGSGQSAALNTAFPNPLSAAVVDASGKPVSGTRVTFTTPSSGPSGAFTGGRSTVTANAVDGVATASSLYADATAGAFTATASIGTGSTATYKLTNVGGTAVVTPTDVILEQGQQVALSVSLTVAAPAGGAFVSFASSNPSVASVPAAVIIPAGQTVPLTPVRLNAAGNGAATITASTPGYLPGATQVQVGTLAGTLNLSPSNWTMNAPGVQTFTLTLSGPVAGGLTVTLSSSDPAVATVPSSVQVPPGGSTVQFPVSALTAGTATITASAPNYASASATVTATGLLAIATTSLPDGSVGSPYSFALNASGGVKPYTWTLISGALPGPLALSPFTGQIVGTPAAAIVRTPLTFKVTDSSSPAQIATANLTLTINAQPAPASIAATAGGGQTANINAVFANPLTATVRDAGGSPVSGATVTFAAPAGGASATFAGASMATATTNAAGVATSPVLAANGVAGSYSVTASVPGVATTASFALTNTSGPAIILPPSISMRQGDQTSLALSLSGTAPSGGVFVTLISSDTRVATVPGAVLIGENRTTPSTNVRLMAAGNGAATLTASAPGYATASAVVRVGTSTGALSFSPAAFTIAAPGLQNITLNLAAPAPLGFTVSLSSSNPSVAAVPAAASIPAGTTSMPIPVTAVSAGSATITASAVDYTDGTASVTVLGALSVTTAFLPDGRVGSAYSFTLTAAGGAKPYTWSLTSGTLPNGLTLTPATGQITGLPAAPVQTTPLTFKVTDASTPAQSATGAFTLTVTAAAAPASISATSGGGQTANVNSAFANVLTATVRDAASNPLSGVTVTFAAPAAGAGAAFPGGNTAVAATTNAAGVATSPPLTANGVAGSYPVTASVQGVASPAIFSLTNTSGPAIVLPASIIMKRGDQTVLPVSLSVPAPVGGVFLSLASSNPAVASVPWAVIIPGGQTAPSSQVRLSANGDGPAAITATATGFSPGTTQVQVGTSTGTIALSPSSSTMTAPGTQVLTLTLSTPAAASLAVSFVSSDPNVVTVPGVVNVPAGASSAQASVTAVAEGSATVTASAPGYSPASAGVTVIGPLVIITTLLPNGQVNAPYTALLAATGGIKPYAWKLSASTPLPGGLQLNGASGSLYGTPTAAVRDYPLTFTVSDAGSPVRSATATLLLTIAEAPALIIAAAGGTPQTAGVNTAFAGALLASVRDSGGNAYANMPVTFTAPATGASGTFLGGAPTAISLTNAQGIAASPPFFANATPGTYTVFASVSGASAPAAFTLTNTSGPAILLPASVGLRVGDQVLLSVLLSSPAPAGGVFVSLASSDTRVATVPAALIIPGGQTTPSSQVRLMGTGNGLATVTATATGFAPGTAQVVVSP